MSTRASDKVRNSTSRVGSGTVKEASDGAVEVFLTMEEMLRLDLLVEERKVKELQKLVHQRDIELKNKDIRILQLECIKLELESSKLHSEADAVGAKSINYVSSIKNKYNIDKEKWGYNPDTGKIVFEG